MARGWSQGELAARAGIPRTTISAIEGQRLTPSVTTALSLARALECSVEELFGGTGSSKIAGTEWAWPSLMEPCRYWDALVVGRSLLYPVESLAVNTAPHDGVWQGGVGRDVASSGIAEKTLVVACCDPAAGILAAEYARASGFRMLLMQRGGEAALTLLKQGLVHVAGVHRSTSEKPMRNAEAVRAQVGKGHRLLRLADWEECLVLPGHGRARSLSSIAKNCRQWALREPGSAARECLDELLGARVPLGHTVPSHMAVADAVRAGWADAGVCVRIVAENAGMRCLLVRTESLDLCFADSQLHDPRIQALISLLRSRGQRRLISELPGYDARHTGEMMSA